MPNLRLAMDAAFWDVVLPSAVTLDGTAKAVPGEPQPLLGRYCSRPPRVEQILPLANRFPFGIIPSFSPPSKSDLGSLALQALLRGPVGAHWLTGFIAQLRPMKLVSKIKQVLANDEVFLDAASDIAQHFDDRSLYSLGFTCQHSPTENTSMLFNIEGSGERNDQRAKVEVVHSLQNHEITLEAALSDLYLDTNGTYWNVPLSLSLDVSSALPSPGLRYRFGLHRNDGQPHALNSSSTDIPSMLQPGLCAKAAFSYEKSKYLWKSQENPVKLELYQRILGSIFAKNEPRDIQLSEPHLAVSGIIGGSCASWFGGNGSSHGSATGLHVDERDSQLGVSRSLHHADFFGSSCLTFQLGSFKNNFNDLTRLDARLDIPSAASLIKGAGSLVSSVFGNQAPLELNPLSTPRFVVNLQQQVIGPFVFRVDSRFSFNPPTGGHKPHLEDIHYGLSWSLKILRSGKILAWYSPRRNEGMVEFRFSEF